MTICNLTSVPRDTKVPKSGDLDLAVGEYLQDVWGLESYNLYELLPGRHYEHLKSYVQLTSRGGMSRYA